MMPHFSEHVGPSRRTGRGLAGLPDGRPFLLLLGPPAMIVVMPPAPGRDHATELLLCGHHYRVSNKALAAAGAVVLDGGAGHEEAMPHETHYGNHPAGQARRRY